MLRHDRLLLRENPNHHKAFLKEAFMQTQVSYEQLEYDVEELRETRDKMTAAVQALLAVIDDSDIFERYPGIESALVRVEALL
jgi:hypothetical protein